MQHAPHFHPRYLRFLSRGLSGNKPESSKLKTTKLKKTEEPELIKPTHNFHQVSRERLDTERGEEVREGGYGACRWRGGAVENTARRPESVYVDVCRWLSVGCCWCCEERKEEFDFWFLFALSPIPRAVVGLRAVDECPAHIQLPTASTAVISTRGSTQ